MDAEIVLRLSIFQHLIARFPYQPTGTAIFPYRLEALR